MKVVALFLLATTWGGVRGALSDWASAADIAVAVGTILLAAATFRLAGEAKKEAAKVAEQVGLEREQLVAAQRPFVLPVIEGWGPGDPFVRLLNAGVGPAINVRGALYWKGGAGGASSLLPTALAAGQPFNAVVVGEGISVNWVNARGFVRYTDLSEAEWQTHFAYRSLPDGSFYVEVLDVGTTEELDEPQYNPDEGWLNAPG